MAALLRSTGQTGAIAAQPAVTATQAAALPQSGTLGYSNLPSGINWAGYKAPTTNNTVYLGQNTAGQYIYVGPDNQPYLGAHTSNFVFGPGGTVMPGAGANPVTWASLGVANANPVVNESNYTGPGASSQATNDTNYAALVAALPGETLATNPMSNLAGAGNIIPPGGVATVTAVAPAPIGTTPAAASTLPTATTTPNGTTGSLDPTTAALLATILGAQQSAASGIAGSGSIGAGLPIIQSQPTTTDASGSYTPLIVIVLIVAGLGFWYWSKHHKKTGKEEGTHEEKAA